MIKTCWTHDKNMLNTVIYEFHITWSVTCDCFFNLVVLDGQVKVVSSITIQLIATLYVNVIISLVLLCWWVQQEQRYVINEYLNKCEYYNLYTFLIIFTVEHCFFITCLYLVDVLLTIQLIFSCLQSLNVLMHFLSLFLFLSL